MNDESLSLSCDNYDANYPEFMSEKLVIARKSHKCVECGRIIKPGEDYERVSGKWDGELITIKTCESCADLRCSLEALGYYISYNDLLEAYNEYLVIIDSNSRAVKTDQGLKRQLNGRSATRSKEHDYQN